MLSTAADPYDPRPSCTTGTDHSAKQDRRVARGAATPPPTRSRDWSTRAESGSPATRSAPAPSPTSARSTTASTRSPPGTTSAPPAPQARPVRVGLLAPPGEPADHQAGARDLQRLRAHADPVQRRSRPAGQERRASRPTRPPGSTRWSSPSAAARTTSRRSSPATPPSSSAPPACAAPTWSPGTRPPGSTSYVKCAGDAACKAEADRRLLTDRWRDDARGGQVDLGGDPNLYSFYFRSRFDLGNGGERRGDLRRHARRLRVDGARRPARRLRPRRRRLHSARRCARRRCGRLDRPRVRAAAARHGR